MKDKVIIALALLTAVLFLIFSDFGATRTKTYDCGMAEWHPDIPTFVRDECRKLRKEQRERDQENKTMLTT